MPRGNTRPIRRKHFSTSIDINLINTLEELSQETRINKSKLVDEALELLFQKHNKTIVQESTEK